MRKLYAFFVLGLLNCLCASAQIVANNDMCNNLEGIVGETSMTDQMVTQGILDNDLLNGSSLASGANLVSLTQVSTTHANVNLVTTGRGSVIVAGGTPAGSYQITYQICEVANPSNCDTAVITVNVCNLPAPTVATTTLPTCTFGETNVLLTGLPATGTWMLHDIDVVYATGTGTSKWIAFGQGTHKITVTSGGCTSPPITVTTGYFKTTMVGTYNDFNADGIVNVGDKVNYQITVKNISSCTLDNIAVTSTQMTVSGNAISLFPNASNSTNFTASHTITQTDITNGFVDKTIRTSSGGNTNIPALFTTARTNLNLANGIRLNAFMDLNGNGSQQANEPQFLGGRFQYRIGLNANHNVVSPNGTITLYETNPLNQYTLGYVVNDEDCQYTTNTAYNNVTVALNSGITTYNFPIVPGNTNCTGLGINLFSPLAPPRPGFAYRNLIQYKNLGNQNIPAGSITFTKDGALVLSALPNGAVATANGFTYAFVNLAPNESRQLVVNMQVPTIPTVALGQQVTNSVSITPADGNMYNNDSSLTQAIVGAYDPNDKTESHGGQISYAAFTTNDYLTYTIRFENTGTANAFNVKVDDVLDSKLEPSSIRMVAASHPYVMDRFGTYVQWKFDNINLPPSVPDTNIGHGYITFRIKPKPGFAIGDVIPNFAEIYFDTNPAIVTNTFNTQFVALNNTDFALNGLKYYPNPVQNNLTVSNIASIEKIEVQSILGQQIMSKKVNDLQASVDLSQVSKGIYLVKIFSDGQQKTIKVIKE